ncbi:hypothetical protein [Pseudomonas peli]|uniref:hypothetical protein n=1 Tax=Pseudomonas peli TaxID=592361 RepID=UPI003D30F6A8
MNKKVLISCLLAVLLVGCDQAGNSEKGGGAGTESAQSRTPENVLFLTDGSGIELNGKIVRDNVAQHNGVSTRRVVVLFDDELQSIDASLYGVLKKAGYRKKLVSSKPEQLVVVYSKKGFPVLRANYDVILRGKKKSSRLILRWQV